MAGSPKRVGRPIIGLQVKRRYQVSLEPIVAQKLRAAAGDNLSGGIAIAAKRLKVAWRCRYMIDPTQNQLLRLALAQRDVLFAALKCAEIALREQKITSTARALAVICDTQTSLIEANDILPLPTAKASDGG